GATVIRVDDGRPVVGDLNRNIVPFGADDLLGLAWRKTLADELADCLRLVGRRVLVGPGGARRGDRDGRTGQQGSGGQVGATAGFVAHGKSLSTTYQLHIYSASLHTNQLDA